MSYLVDGVFCSRQGPVLCPRVAGSVDYYSLPQKSAPVCVLCAEHRVNSPRDLLS